MTNPLRPPCQAPVAKATSTSGRMSLRARGREGGLHPSYGSRSASLACRALAIALAFVVTVGVVAIGVLRPSLIEATRTMSSLLPSALQGTFVFETPLGGALRGDFVIASIVLFVSDWLLVRCAYRLRTA